jgi:hypothetical protein
MTVNISISSTSGGDPLPEVVDLGQVSPGYATTAYDLYIRHDAENFKISDCAFYVVRYTGSNYTGAEDPDTDYSEIISWGDTTYADDPTANGVEIDLPVNDNDHGGLYLNQVHPTYDDAEWYVVHTGYGSDSNNSIQLLSTAINDVGTGSAVDGEIPLNGEAHIQTRWDMPKNLPVGSNAGIRFIQMVMAYSYTS